VTAAKSDVRSRVTGVIHQLEQRADDLSDRAGDAQKLLGTWAARARRFTRKNPGTVLIGAVAFGFVLARAARHA
jgi:hypothetical protein